MIRASVVGAIGYAGAEIIDILLRHKYVQLVHATELEGGKRLDSILTHLRNRCNLVLEKTDIKRLAQDSDVAFFALPHGVGSKAIAEFVKYGKKAIDISADYRIRNKAQYEKIYGVKHGAPKLLKEAVYGLPELYRDQIKKTKIVANPGCFPTTVILGLAPLVKRGLVNVHDLVSDSKTGISGAGRKPGPKFHFPEATENFQAYNVAKHRHQPEMEQILSQVGRRSVKLTFVPQLTPMNRGILSVLYATLKRKMKEKYIRKLYAEDYGKEPFVRLMPEGEWPQTKNVAHTNFCDINVKVDERMNRVMVFAAIDNLVKGAAGQAVQNMNLLFGYNETEGLI